MVFIDDFELSLLNVLFIIFDDLSVEVLFCYGLVNCVMFYIDCLVDCGVWFIYVYS